MSGHCFSTTHSFINNPSLTLPWWVFSKATYSVEISEHWKQFGQGTENTAENKQITPFAVAMISA